MNVTVRSIGYLQYAVLRASGCVIAMGNRPRIRTLLVLKRPHRLPLELAAVFRQTVAIGTIGATLERSRGAWRRAFAMSPQALTLSRLVLVP